MLSVSPSLLHVLTVLSYYRSMDYGAHTEAATKALADKVAQGVVKYRYHIIEGLKEAPRGILMLFTGKNNGKLYV